MTAPDDLLVLNNAASQRDRLREAPAPREVKVDGRSLADLLAFAADYGALVTFYDLSNTADGHWAVFFRGDGSIRLALQASLDLAGIQAEFDRILGALRATQDVDARLERMQDAIAVLLRLVRILTGGHMDPAGIEEALARLIGSERRDILAAPARALSAHLGGNSIAQGLRRDLQGLVDGWYERFLDMIQELVASVLTALAQGRAAAAGALDASFHDQSHAPQSGLYDAFAVLLGHAQDSINTFPERLVHFYRSTILQQHRRDGRPDSLCLTFTPAKGVTRADLPAGTAFLAGVDSDGQTIAYALESALSVDAAALAALRTLTVARGATGRPARVLSGIVTLAKTAPPIATPFPIFGTTEIGTNGVLETGKASLGFALASPALMLTGGTRTIEIGLTIADLDALTPALEAIGAASGLAAQDVLVQVLEAAFALRCSTTGGWIDVPAYAVTPPAAGAPPLFVLSFALDADAAPFVAPTAAADDLPVLSASLLQDPVMLGAPPSAITVYPYEILSGVTLSALAITVTVADLADLRITVTGAPVDTSQPFAAFGSPPVQHAALEIAAPELFVKPVTAFTLSLDWAGLPVTSTGFYGYYMAYVIDADGKTVAPGSQFDNQSFTTEIDMVNPGWWTIPDQNAYLFQTSKGVPMPEAEAPLQPHTIVAANVGSSTPPAFYDPATSAVRLRLATPDVAFGNVLYAPNVMAASVQLTAAASACAQQCGSSGSGGSGSSGGGGTTPVAHLAPVAAANAAAPDGELAAALKGAIRLAVANLDGAALKTIEDAIAASDADPEERADRLASLTAALGEPRPGSWLQRLLPWRTRRPDAAAVHENLSAWLDAHAPAIAADAAVLRAARAMLDAGSALLQVQESAARQPPAIARPMTAVSLREVQDRLAVAQGEDDQDCIQKCMANANLTGFPNQPWLPMATNVTVTYTAAVALPAEAAGDTRFFHLLPFDEIAPVAWPAGGSVPLLAPIDAAGTLQIGLSAPTGSLSLLFRLAAPAGGWPSDLPPLVWSQAGETGWIPLTPLRDTTNGLRNSGIVSLALDTADAAPWLRIGVARDADAFPMLAGLIPNAAMAQWIGPGGAAALGTPLPAGTITKPLTPLAAIGTIDQPLPSSGGAPPIEGAALDIWLAERLRHKDRGIQGWDDARLLLAAFPSLWQVAIVPASDGGILPAPGHVWVVPVPGPQTPAIADPIIPSNDSTMLGDVASYLAGRISPFIQLTVTNPPYRRITVHADVVIAASDAVDAALAQLNTELIHYLSPWPAPALPPRPDDYYTLRQIAHFIRHRPYVCAILSIALVPDPADAAAGWHYLTSAEAHHLTGHAQPAMDLPNPPRLSLPHRRDGRAA